MELRNIDDRISAARAAGALLGSLFTLIVVLALGAASGVEAQLAGSVTFSPPTSGGAPTGYRLYRDNTLVGNVTSGQTFTALFPSNTGSWVIGVEAFNAQGAGPRVNKTVTVGAPPPGPVGNFVITLNCANTNPPTCTVTVVDAP